MYYKTLILIGTVKRSNMIVINKKQHVSKNKEQQDKQNVLLDDTKYLNLEVESILN